MRYVFIVEGKAPADALRELELMGKLFVSDLRQDEHEVTVAAIKFPDNTGEKVDLLVSRAMPGDEENIYTGRLIDSIIKTLLGNMTLAFDRKKFIKHPEFKKSIQCLAIAAKDSATLPANIDDILIDQAVMLLEGIIDQQQLDGPLEVGATPDQMARPKRLRRIRTLEEVKAEIVKAGGDPNDTTKFNPAILLLLQYLPNLIEFIMKLINKQ